MHLDPLESRRLLSAAIEDHVLLIRGTAQDDTIYVHSTPNGQIVVLDNGNMEFFDPAAFNRIVIRLGKGQDTALIDDYSDGMVNEKVRAYGGAGSDSLQGGNGKDTLVGGKGNDTITGGGGNDRITAGAGHDWLRGDDGNDTILAGSGRDTLEGSGFRRGADLLRAGPGDDWIYYDSSDTVDAGSGNNGISLEKLVK